MMPILEFTFRVPVAEETLDRIREQQDVADFGADEALGVLRDAMPAATLIHVRDDNS
jgi:hypothetical protein